MRAPRIASARIDWPSQPVWTTPLPTGLFGGETVHAFAGFDVAPAGDAALQLAPADDGKRLTARIALPSEVNDARTLARIAAARRVETAEVSDKLRLALDYGLLTDRTNLLVVHERAVGERAGDLPTLATVPQMLAAGWHGMGSVHAQARVKASAATIGVEMPHPLRGGSTSAHVCVSFDDLDQPAVVRRARAHRPPRPRRER